MVALIDQRAFFSNIQIQTQVVLLFFFRTPARPRTQNSKEEMSNSFLSMSLLLLALLLLAQICDVQAIIELPVGSFVKNCQFTESS